MSKATLLFLNALSLLATIVLNYLLNSGLMSGVTMKTISDRYYNLFTPAGYAFGIWGIIYLLLVAHIIYTIYLYKKEMNTSIINATGKLFIGSNIVNILWVYCWLNDLTMLCVILMALLLYLLLRILTRIQSIKRPVSLRNLLISCPFALYSGWVSVALIANISALLTKLNWDGWILTEVVWTILLIIVAGIISIYVSWKYNVAAFGMAVLWGICAVTANNFGKNFNITLTGILTCIVILSVSIYIITTKIDPELKVD